MQQALRCWDAAIEQARAEGQFKWASALVNRRHAAKMADLRQTARPKLVLNTELQRTMDLIDAVAERYAIPLPEPSSASKLPDPQGPTAHGS